MQTRCQHQPLGLVFRVTRQFMVISEFRPKKNHDRNFVAVYWIFY